MADLDSFFAKKDKKKKTKKGFSKANTEVLAKNLEENERREMKADVAMASLATSEATKLAFEESPGLNGEIGPSSNAGRKDEEWLDYENERKDYSGLKIETLKISETPDEDESDDEINEEGEKVIKVKKAYGGPWNKGATQPGNDEEEASSEEESQEQNVSSTATDNKATNATSSSAVKSSYVPPHLRGGGSANTSNSMASGPNMNPMRMNNRGRGNRQAPDINNEMYFPSLGSVSQSQPSDKSRSGRNDFEEVRGGGSGNQQPGPRSSEAPKLTLGNKFDALRD